MTQQNSKKFLEGPAVVPARTTFILPAYTLAVPSWSGVSTIVQQYIIGNTDYNFSFKLPIPNLGSNVVFAIRWKIDDICYRYLLTTNSLMVLHYPTYNGERVGFDAILEMWDINNALAPTLAADANLEGSVLVFPTVDTARVQNVTQPTGSITLEATAASTLPGDGECNPFCDTFCVP